MAIWKTLSPPWQRCLEEAWTAYCAGSIPIGAAITDSNGLILSSGRNRIFESTAEAGHLHGHRLAHAEMNALVTLDWGPVDPSSWMGSRVDPRSCVLYTTTEPCPLCFGALYVSGIPELRYASRDPFGGATDLLGTTPYLSRKRIIIAGPECACLEAIVMALHVEFSLHREGVPARRLVNTWEQVAPEGVELGRRLAESGDLRRMRAAARPVQDVVNQLAETVAPLP